MKYKTKTKSNKKYLYIIFGIIFVFLFFKITNYFISQKVLYRPNAAVKVKKSIQGKYIMGGEEVINYKKWPFVVNIYWKQHGASTGRACSGSLIDHQWVLTAGHCLLKKNDKGFFDIDEKISSDELGVYFGSNDFLESDQTFDIEEIFIHPRFYNEDPLSPPDHDLALIKLNKKLIMNASPISLGTDEIFYNEGTMTVALGWGIHNFDNSYTTTKLGQIIMPILSNGRADGYITEGVIMSPRKDNTIAIGYPSDFYHKAMSSCGGDSGGPVIVWNMNGKKWVLIGIITFSEFDCSAKFIPAGAVKLMYKSEIDKIDYLSWIKGTINRRSIVNLKGVKKIIPNNRWYNFSGTFKGEEIAKYFVGETNEATIMNSINYFYQHICIDRELGYAPLQSCN